MKKFEMVVNEWKKYSKNKKRNYYPNHLKELAVQLYIQKDKETLPLATLIEDLDTELRNALVHENYFIKDQVIHYFRIISLESKKFEEKTMDIQLFRLYFFSILIFMNFIDL